MDSEYTLQKSRELEHNNYEGPITLGISGDFCGDLLKGGFYGSLLGGLVSPVLRIFVDPTPDIFAYSVGFGAALGGPIYAVGKALINRIFGASTESGLEKEINSTPNKENPKD